MSIRPGTHRFGPESSALWIRTGRSGAVAQVGHDLLIQVTAWQATLDVGEDATQTSIALDVDSTSLRVREGVGGVQALGDGDKASIQETIDDEILKQMDIAFRSSAVHIPPDGSRIGVQGELTLVGTARPIEFDLIVGENGDLSGTIVLEQTNWGITPYSTLFGALKVADQVEVIIHGSRSGTPSGDTPDGLEWSAPWDVEWRPTPLLDPGISSFLWALVFFLYLWLGMTAVGVFVGTALILALVSGIFIFVLVRTHGVGRDPDD